MRRSSVSTPTPSCSSASDRSVDRSRHRLAASRPGPQLGQALKPVPVLEQYEAVKREHPDAIVLFRLGDFYETFGDDAERAAPLLGITLTSRELGKGQRFPMAGVPYHAYENYVGKLLRAGLKVALCDQVEQAGGARGVGGGGGGPGLAARTVGG